MSYRTMFSLHNTHHDQQLVNNPRLFIASSVCQEHFEYS